MTGIASILLIASCLFSFLSIRTNKQKLAFKYENLADYIFIVGLFLVFVITFLVAFSLIY